MTLASTSTVAEFSRTHVTVTTYLDSVALPLLLAINVSRVAVYRINLPAPELVDDPSFLDQLLRVDGRRLARLGEELIALLLVAQVEHLGVHEVDVEWLTDWCEVHEQCAVGKSTIRIAALDGLV